MDDYFGNIELYGVGSRYLYGVNFALLVYYKIVQKCSKKHLVKVVCFNSGQTHEKIKIAYSNNSVYDTVKEKQRSLV